MPPPAPSAVSVEPARRLRGRVRLPGDKSVSHRYALLAALAEGTSSIGGYAPGADCASTLACLRALGVAARWDAAGRLLVSGRGLRGLAAPEGPLDAGNSGTTLRLLAGILAAHAFSTVLTGDASLRRRPMRRVIVPLERMGAHIDSNDGHAPLTVRGAALSGIEYVPEVPSAQVKSAVLLAGLQARGTTVVREPAPTRDHTERALEAFGARLERRGTAIVLEGGQALRPQRLEVPGDPSSAAFWAVAAAALPGSEVELAGVGLNPTRTALFDVLRRLGAAVEATVERVEAGEPSGRVVVRPASLAPLVIRPPEVPGLIDELPALAALATFGGGLEVTGASELRAKESDRITALVAGLAALGADAHELPDGFVVRPTRRLAGGTADSQGDHRLAMAFAVAALGAQEPSTVLGAEAVAVSYPEFFEVLDQLRD